MDNFQAVCSRCGTSIKNVITINGKPYGTECATKIIGIDDLPFWFKGGDWDRSLAKRVASEEQRKSEFEFIKGNTNKHWADFLRLSKAYRKACSKQNEWQINFIASLCRQCNFPAPMIEGCRFNTFDEALIGWDDSYMGSFPWIKKESTGIGGLSVKQQELLHKNESLK